MENRNYEQMFFNQISMTQELASNIKELKTKNSSLKTENEQLKKELAALKISANNGQRRTGEISLNRTSRPKQQVPERKTIITRKWAWQKKVDVENDEVHHATHTSFRTVPQTNAIQKEFTEVCHYQMCSTANMGPCDPNGKCASYSHKPICEYGAACENLMCRQDENIFHPIFHCPIEASGGKCYRNGQFNVNPRKCGNCHFLSFSHFCEDSSSTSLFDGYPCFATPDSMYCTHHNSGKFEDDGSYEAQCDENGEAAANEQTCE